MTRGEGRVTRGEGQGTGDEGQGTGDEGQDGIRNDEVNLEIMQSGD